MKFTLSLICLFAICVSSFSQSTFPEDGIKTKQSVYTLFKGATIHQAPGKTIVTDLIIFKDKIVHCGPVSSYSLSENTQTIALTGYHIYPSFIELSSEYGISPSKKEKTIPGPSNDRLEDRATYWNEAIHPEMRASALFKPDSDLAKSLREKGFGIALVHQQNGIARGTSALVGLGGGNANEQVIRAEAAAHFSFSKGKSSQDYPSSLMGSIALLRQAFYDATWFANAPDPESNISLEALIGQRSLPLIFEASDKYDILRIEALAKEFNLPFIIKGKGDAYQVLPITDRTVSAIITPLDFPKPFDVSDPDINRYISQDDLMHWERAPFNPYFIQQSKIPLILSGDGVEKGSDFFKALQKAIASGLHRDSAFAALTTTPARILGVSDVTGQLEKGLLANFFISKEDVFKNPEATIASNWIKGVEYTITDILAIDLTGSYDLNVNDTYHSLQVTGTDQKFKGEISTISENDTLKTKAEIRLQGHEITLSFVAPDSAGYFRLNGTSASQNRIWDGMGTDPDGKLITWSAIRKVNKKQPQPGKESKNKSDSIPPVAPALRFPMVAYGFDSLPEAETLLIYNATIWTNELDGTIENGSILISEGKILAVGKSIKAEDHLRKRDIENMKRLDGKGKHITAGIIDEHSHIAITRGVNEGTQASTAEVRISDALNPEDINIYRQLSGGVTTSQLLHGSANPIGGQSAIIKLRWGRPMEQMLFAEAPGFIKFALGENVKQTNWGDLYRSRYPQTRMGVEQFYYDYFYRAKEYGELKKISSPSEKASSRLKKTEESSFRRDLEMEALLEILEGQRHITCHAYVQSEIDMLMHVADSMGFRINTFTHILEGYKLADKMKEHGAAGSTFSDWWAYKYEVKDAIPHNAAVMHEMGVLTGINSDDGEMGRRLNQEAAKSIKYAGMSESDALKMVTLNPATMLHVDEYVGSLKPGKHADIVVWSGHPLSVYSKAEVTFVDGCRYFDRAKSEALMNRDSAERARIFNLMEKAKSGGEETKKPERKIERYYHCDSED